MDLMAERGVVGGTVFVQGPGRDGRRGPEGDRNGRHKELFDASSRRNTEQWDMNPKLLTENNRAGNTVYVHCVVLVNVTLNNYCF